MRLLSRNRPGSAPWDRAAVSYRLRAEPEKRPLRRRPPRRPSRSEPCQKLGRKLHLASRRFPLPCARNSSPPPYPARSRLRSGSTAPAIRICSRGKTERFPYAQMVSHLPAPTFPIGGGCPTTARLGTHAPRPELSAPVRPCPPLSYPVTPGFPIPRVPRAIRKMRKIGGLGTGPGLAAHPFGYKPPGRISHSAPPVRPASMEKFEKKGGE